MHWGWFVIAAGACLWLMSISLRSFLTTTVIPLFSLAVLLPVTHTPHAYKRGCWINLHWHCSLLQLWRSLKPVEEDYGVTSYVWQAIGSWFCVKCPSVSVHASFCLDWSSIVPYFHAWIRSSRVIRIYGDTYEICLWYVFSYSN